MTTSLIHMLGLSIILSALMMGNAGGIRQWYLSLPYNQQFGYAYLTLVFSALIASRFVLYEAALIVVMVLYLNIVGFLLWLASKI